MAEYTEPTSDSVNFSLETYSAPISDSVDISLDGDDSGEDGDTTTPKVWPFGTVMFSPQFNSDMNR